MAGWAEFDNDPELSAEASFRRGVTVSFLVAWTVEHDCWDLPTWQVQRDVIKKLTAERQCRLTELDGIESGPSDVFMCVP